MSSSSKNFAIEKPNERSIRQWNDRISAYFNHCFCFLVYRVVMDNLKSECHICMQSKLPRWYLWNMSVHYMSLRFNGTEDGNTQKNYLVAQNETIKSRCSDNSKVFFADSTKICTCYMLSFFFFFFTVYIGKG